MRRTQTIGPKRATLAILIATLLLPTPSGAREPDQYISVGFNLLDEAAYKFGEYTGLVDDKAYFVGDLISYSDLPGATGRIGLEVREPGLPSRSVGLGYKKQGLLSLGIEYSEIPHFEQRGLFTPYRGAGGQALILPDGWQTGATVPDLTNLNSSLLPFNAETRRRKLGVGGDIRVGTGWTALIDYHRETKQGTDLTSALFGIDAAPRSAVVPVPVDWTNDFFEVAVGRAGELGNVNLGYRYSGFRNSQDWLTFESMFDSFPNVATDYPNGLGQMALDPDNDAHHLSFDGLYRLGSSTRASLGFRWGRLTQDARLLDYTATAGISAPLATPRGSAEGKADTIHLDVALASRPLPKTNLRLRYAFDRRDTKTPRAAFFTVINDARNQPATSDDRAVLINQPFSHQRHFVALDGDYRFNRAFKLNLGFDFEATERDFVAVTDMLEWTPRTKLIFRPLTRWSGWLEYAFTDRTGSDYTSNRAFVTSRTPAFLETQAAGNNPYLIFNDPLLRRYFIADQQEHRIDLYSSFAPIDRFDLGLKAGYLHAKNDASPSGLLERTRYNAGLDLGLEVGPRFGLTAFGEYAGGEANQRGYQWDGTDPSSTIPPQRSLASTWQTDSRNDLVSAGAGVVVVAVPEKLDLLADYHYMYDVTRYDQSQGGLSGFPLPDVTTRLHNLELQLDYHLEKEMILSVVYRHERWTTDDFALDGVFVASDESTAAVIFANERAHRYQVNLIGVTATYEF